MVPIELKSGQPFRTLDEFRDYFIRTCEEHRNENRAKAFAFIVYDFTNENTRKILRDSEYSTALHRLSGKWLTILYVNATDPEFRQVQKKQDKSSKRSSSKERLKKGDFGHMYSMTASEFDLDETASYLRQAFEVDDYTPLPFVVFFQTGENRILRSFSVAIRDKEVEPAYRELKELVENAIKTISKMHNFDDPGRILDLIEDAVNGSRHWKMAKKIGVSMAGGLVMEILKKMIIG